MLQIFSCKTCNYRKWCRKFLLTEKEVKSVKKKQFWLDFFPTVKKTENKILKEFLTNSFKLEINSFCNFYTKSLKKEKLSFNFNEFLKRHENTLRKDLRGRKFFIKLIKILLIFFGLIFIYQFSGEGFVECMMNGSPEYSTKFSGTMQEYRNLFKNIEQVNTLKYEQANIQGKSYYIQRTLMFKKPLEISDPGIDDIFLMDYITAEDDPDLYQQLKIETKTARSKGVGTGLRYLFESVSESESSSFENVDSPHVSQSIANVKSKSIHNVFPSSTIVNEISENFSDLHLKNENLKISSKNELDKVSVMAENIHTDSKKWPSWVKSNSYRSIPSIGTSGEYLMIPPSEKMDQFVSLPKIGDSQEYITIPFRKG